jgi:phosphohistidine phosphatase
MKVYLVRHGEPLSIEVSPEQVLSEKGKTETTRLAKHLANCDLQIPHIMHSCKSRARETAAIFAEYLESDLKECESILNPEADVIELSAMIQSWENDTMIVAHLPMLAKLTSALVVDNPDFFPITNFPPSTILCLDHYENGRWIIDWMLRPSIIPEFPE